MEGRGRAAPEPFRGFALASEHEGITTEKLIIIADKGMYDEKSRFYRQRADDNR